MLGRLLLAVVVEALLARESSRVVVEPTGFQPSDWSSTAAAFAGFPSSTELPELRATLEEDGAAGNGRRLQTGVQQCPNGVGLPDSQLGYVTLSGVSDSFGIYSAEAGYGAYLLCQWHIAPSGRQHITFVFDNFDVSCCDRDLIEIIQLQCQATVVSVAPRCDVRKRVNVLSYPTSFAQNGVLPPAVTLTDEGGFGVEALVRFRSKFATGSPGFSVSYSTEDFNLMSINPYFVPTTMETTVTLTGVGLTANAELKCILSGQTAGDVLYIPATVSASSSFNNTATCLVTTRIGAGVEYYGDDSSRLYEGVYTISLQKRSSSTGGIISTPTALSLIVYQSPVTWRRFDPIVPVGASYNDNVTVFFDTPFRWLDPTHAIDYTGIQFEPIYQIRFAQRTATRLLPSTTVSATVVGNDALSARVPMPFLGGDSNMLIEVSFNSQQFDSGQSGNLSAYPNELFFKLNFYCSGLITLRNETGEITDHATSSSGVRGISRPYSSCRWLILLDNIPDVRITLELNPESFITTVGRDYVAVYDGSTLTAPQLLRWPNSFDAISNIPSAVRSSGQAMLVEFRTGAQSEGTGFIASYSATRPGKMRLISLTPSSGASQGATDLHVTAAMAEPWLARAWPDTYKCYFTEVQRSPVLDSLPRASTKHLGASRLPRGASATSLGAATTPLRESNHTSRSFGIASRSIYITTSIFYTAYTSFES